ncbi:hypothetical protein ABZ915_18195 [Streptomyces sp. NPDC046915]|uniref:hypothetical protein n=1 Tax=Streptomyces sp. NPDC046915 TaxID=3155257 RepID=UPI0033F0FD04
MDEAFGTSGFDDARCARLRAHPPEGCVPVDWGSFALKCERPGTTLLDAVTDTVAEVRREHGVDLDSLGIEKPEEWFGEGKDGFKGEAVAHLRVIRRRSAG